MPEHAPDALLADKGYDADAIRADLVERKINAVIPGRSNRRVKIEHDRVLYKQRNRIERMFGHLKINRAIATRYDQLANSFLQMFMQMLATKAQGQFLPERFVVEALNYLQTGVTLARTWQDMKPNVMALITHVLFPMLCFDAKDQELWEDDPHEFVRKTHDIMEDYTSERVASCNLILGALESSATLRIGCSSRFSMIAFARLGPPPGIFISPSIRAVMTGIFVPGASVSSSPCR